MVSLRTQELKEKYQEYLKTAKLSEACPLCEREPVKSFTHWKVIKNHFPYDKIAETHHMLVPLRHISEDKLSAEELGELKSIKQDFINLEYDWILEATHKNKSIPGHFHLHLIVGKAS